MKKYILEITAFLCGVVVMILELVGSRVIAPFLGTSTFVWTSIIGVILASLSVGYWWGGKIADKNPSVYILARAILIGGIFISSIAFLQPLLGVVATIGSLRLGAVLASLIFFAPATIALGMVSPLVVKLSIKQIENTGSIVGRLYALSTVGSILGTFLGGFFLISYIGTTHILLVLGIVTVLNSLALYLFIGNKKVFTHIGCLIILIPALSGLLKVTLIADAFTEVKDVDTNYNRLIVYDALDRASNRPTRYITNNLNLVQSGMYIDNPNELLFPYVKAFDLINHFNPDVKHMLMIGAGGYSYPKYVQKNYPDKTMDVVEIDPGYTDLAKEYFGFKESPTITTHHEDGRIFLNNAKQAGNSYDAILVDAFSSQYAIPFQLTTLEAVNHMNDILTDNGVVMVNIVSGLTGPKSEFLQAEYATYKKVFPQVLLIQAKPLNSELLQNVLLVALKSTSTPSLIDKNSDFQSYLNLTWTGVFVPTFPVLTDDYAPVDRYIEKLY